MTQPLLPFDICERRHKGNKNSAKAAEKVQNTKAAVHERIRVFVAACPTGATCKEIAAALEHPTKGRKYFPNEVSGRISEMKVLGVLIESGMHREGSSVLMVRKEWTKQPQ